MSKNHIQYKIVLFSDLISFKKTINSHTQNNNSIIWLKGNLELLMRFANEIHQIIKQKGLNIAIEESIELTQIIKAQTILTSNPENIPQIKKALNNINIGVFTSEIAECKNAELFEADFVLLGPFEKIGIEPYINLTPLKPKYEWMILNIIIPVFAFGKLSKMDIQKLKDNCLLGDFSD